MHHVALDGTGANDGHFNNQIIKCARAHTRQKIHLRTAFDLKHAKRIRDAEHVVNFRVFLRDRCDRIMLALPIPKQMKGFANTGEHAEREHIDFQHADFINIVLIPFDDCAVRHGGIFNGAHFVQPPRRDDKATDMLREMTRKADNLAGELYGLAQARVSGVQPRRRNAVITDAFAASAPNLGGQSGDGIFGQAHRFADFANGGAAAEVNDRRAYTRAVTAIFFVDMLDDFFAAFMFEIDINIGRFPAHLRDKTLEHHRDGFRRRFGNAKCVTDHRISRTPASLAKNILATRKGNDVIDRQKISRVIQLCDELELFLDHGPHARRQPVRIAPDQPIFSETPQARVGVFAIRDFIRIFIFQLIQRERAALHDSLRIRDSLWIGFK